MTDWLSRIFPYVGAMRLRDQLLRSTPKPLLVLYPSGLYRLRTINGKATHWYYCVVEVQPDSLSIYPRTRTTQECFLFAISELRWFGRPKKYQAGNNHIWLHLEHEGHWLLLELRLYKTEMQDLVRAIKTITHETMVKAYRRQRPYLHYGPTTAYPGVQDIYGAWTLGKEVSLYIMPLYVVILDGDQVLRVLPLSDIQQIMALPRLDAPTKDGLVRFRVAEEAMAFAIEQHQLFADKLAEAAKRSLEEPPLRKQKGYDEEWE